MSLHPLTVTSLLLAAVLVTSCSQGLPPAQAQARAESLLSALRDGKLDQAVAMYSDEFFLRQTTAQWRAELQRHQDTLGAMQSFTLRKQQYDSRYSARFYLYEFQTVHERGRAWQTVTVINPVGTTELKIVGHKIRHLGGG